MKNRRLWVVALLIVLPAILFSTAEAKKDDQIVVALGGDVEGWDPVTVIYYAAGEIVRNCYDSLLTLDVIPAEKISFPPHNSFQYRINNHTDAIGEQIEEEKTGSFENCK